MNSIRNKLNAKVVAIISLVSAILFIPAILITAFMALMVGFGDASDRWILVPMYILGVVTLFMPFVAIGGGIAGLFIKKGRTRVTKATSIVSIVFLPIAFLIYFAVVYEWPQRIGASISEAWDRQINTAQDVTPVQVTLEEVRTIETRTKIWRFSPDSQTLAVLALSDTSNENDGILLVDLNTGKQNLVRVKTALNGR